MLLRKHLRRRPSAAMAGQMLMAILCALLLPSPILGIGSPPHYSRNNMPNTTFTCDDKTSGGYYADYEAECQMFHVCVRVSEEEISDHKFLCPNNTIFDQQNLICASWWDTECNETPIIASDPFNIFEEARQTTSTDATPTQASPSVNKETAPFHEHLSEDEGPSLVKKYDFSLQSRTGRSKKEKNIPLGRSVVQPSPFENAVSSSTEKSAITGPPSSVGVTGRPAEALSSSTIGVHAFQLPFEASFAVGKPVVSISSTSSRLEVSSPRYESSTPKYGYFSVQLPSTTAKYDQDIKYVKKSLKVTAKPEISLQSTSISSVTSQQVQTSTKHSELSKVREFKTSDLSSIYDVEDPFADIDWQKVSPEVSETAKKRHKIPSEPSSAIKSNPQVVAIGRQRKPETESVSAARGQSTSITSSVSSSARVTASRVLPSVQNKPLRDGLIGGRTRDWQRPTSTGRPPKITTRPSRQDFSNFRYFRTAFGDQPYSTSKSRRTHRQRPTRRYRGAPPVRRTVPLENSRKLRQRAALRYSALAEKT